MNEGNLIGIIGTENVTMVDGEPVISEAGYDRLLEAVSAGRITVPPGVLESARAVKAEAERIRATMKGGLN